MSNIQVSLLLFAVVVVGTQNCLAADAVREKTTRLRTWTDVTGKHTVQAEFVDFQDGIVRLNRENGSIIEIPIDRLFLNDQERVRRKSDASGQTRLRDPIEKSIPIKEEQGPQKAVEDAAVAAAARVRKQLSERLDNKGQVLERPRITGLSSSNPERLAAFLLLAQYGGRNVDSYTARIKSVPAASLDAWSTALSNKSAESIGKELMFVCLPHVEGLFTRDRFQQTTSEVYLRRLVAIPGPIVKTWTEVLRRLDDEDELPVSNTLLLMVQTEEMFEGSAFQESLAKPVFERLNALRPAPLQAMAKRMEQRNLKLLAILLAAEEDLFDGQTLRMEAVRSLSRKLPGRGTAARS